MTGKLSVPDKIPEDWKTQAWRQGEFLSRSGLQPTNSEIWAYQHSTEERGQYERQSARAPIRLPRSRLDVCRGQNRSGAGAMRLPYIWCGGRLQRLLMFANDGRSAGEIAVLMATTRNAIIGACHRNNIALKRGNEFAWERQRARAA